MTGERCGTAGRSALADALQASIAGDELANYAVRNLGLRRRQRERRLGCASACGPAVVSPIAFSALLYWLHDRPKSTASDLVPGRASGRTRCSARATTSCAGCCSASRPAADEREGDFLQVAASAAPAVAASSPLRGVLSIWSDSGGKYDRERLHPLLEKALNGRFVRGGGEAERPVRARHQGCRQRAAQARASTGCRARSDCASRTSRTTPTASGSPGPIATCCASGEPDLGDVDAVIALARSRRARASATAGCWCRSSATGTSNIVC